MPNVAVVGTGYVGLTTGACFAEMGHRVSCIDIDAAKIEHLRRGEVPLYEPDLQDVVQRNKAAGRLSFTTVYGEGLAGSDFVFIAVGTPPSADGSGVEMKFVNAATKSIAAGLNERAIVINKSTTPIGTGGRLTKYLDSTNPGLAPWRVVSNPEFLREGSAVDDCLHPARVVLGSDDEVSAAAVAELYRDFNCPIIITDLNTAEMIKYASNAYLATRISFINEVARICEALGADVPTVARGMGLDPRIGSEFLEAGLGFGGSCFPKDVAALKHMAAGAGLHPQLLTAVTEINDDQRRWVIEKLGQQLGGLTGKVIALWGLAFKPNTDDTREAPAVDVARRLLGLGATLRLVDPVARPDIDGEYCDSPEESAAGADAVLIATPWEVFTRVDWGKVGPLMRGDVVFDARNCLNPNSVTDAGLHYIGIGRRPSAVGSVATRTQ